MNFTGANWDFINLWIEYWCILFSSPETSGLLEITWEQGYVHVVTIQALLISLLLSFSSSLGYRGKDVPGEVRTLEISPTNPKQVNSNYHVAGKFDRELKFGGLAVGVELKSANNMFVPHAYDIMHAIAFLPPPPPPPHPSTYAVHIAT